MCMPGFGLRFQASTGEVQGLSQQRQGQGQGEWGQGRTFHDLGPVQSEQAYMASQV